MNKGNKRYSDIAAAHTNPNWKWVRIKKGYKGSAGSSRSDKGKFWAPEPSTKEKLIIYLHEVAHLTLKHFSGNPIQRAINEHEAVTLSLQWLAEAGVRVGRDLLRKQKDLVAHYVFMAILHATDEEIENPPPKFDEAHEYCMT